MPAVLQELCRQRMAARPSERPETARTSRVSSVSSQFSDGPMPSPSARGSTSSWSEEPVQPNMDISTGHMVLVRPAPSARGWEGVAARGLGASSPACGPRRQEEGAPRPAPLPRAPRGSVVPALHRTLGPHPGNAHA